MFNCYEKKNYNYQIKKISTTDTQDIFEKYQCLRLKFLIEFKENFAYYIVKNRIYKIDILKNTIVFQEFQKNINDDLHNVNLSVFDNEIIISSGNNIIFLTPELQISRTMKHQSQIITPMSMFNNSYVFCDISDGLVRINHENFFIFRPEYLGDQIHNPQNNLLIHENIGIYGSSISQFYLVDLNSLELIKNIEVDSNINYLNQKPLVHNNRLWLHSDREIQILDMNNHKTIKKINSGSFFSSVLLDNHRIFADTNKLAIINEDNLDHHYIPIDSATYICGIFKAFDRCFVINNKGNVFFINKSYSGLIPLNVNLESKHPIRHHFFKNQNFLFKLNQWNEVEIYQMFQEEI